ncbi:MAG: hypothetical protein BECKG1743D_GA0114223_104061 [Candidatus Kentron sp. G]|nr:MAG: hypothetical protein BECKG1743F_GA0114225_105141 [Candidatus Kentron sp. G]VFN02443.1 MAG: hypothetical protein BECKG1743E_GA0114224_105071 [Candidatus Kentron sp. G]VFN02869.1 MAG: hypothetical protein BECKG1743D_GA0114223_104061 [Candidatus Kentron sp. G]
MSISSEFLTMLGVQDDFCIQLKLVYEKVAEPARQTPAQALPEPSRSHGQARYRDLF